MIKEIDKFCAARRSVITHRFGHLNEMQRKAVLATEGPLLVLAGAGSGKTTVLINRVANLMRYGSAADSGEVPDWVTEDDAAFLEDYANAPDEAGAARADALCRLNPAAPWSILAITFTNKAAGELKDRLERQLGPAALDVWAATFHSTCVRILRRDGGAIGLASSFTIYDAADSLRVIKDILKEIGADEKTFPPRMVQSMISRAKDENKTAGEYMNEAGDLRRQKVAKVYLEYEKRLWGAGALDFDDLILQTVRMLTEHKSVREFYQNKFRYVLVDEYQDTNHLQYLLTGLLTGRHKNLCVVGDDDQSIYRFRGATIENILSFEEQYKGARVIRLEQNYRSTGNILDAANAVIANNQGRKGKTLWTGAARGPLLHLHTAMNEHDEAQYTANEILSGYQAGQSWRDFAVLYRMNAQSNQLERACKKNGIPYRIIGGTRFFDRAEIKDVLAYLCVIQNPGDDLRLLRIINTPSRKLGQTTVEAARGLAAELGVPIYDVLRSARLYPELSKAASRLLEFAALIAGLRELAQTMDLEEFYQEVLTRSGYEAMLAERDTVEERTRLENVRELRSSIREYIRNAEDTPTLSGFLDEIALFTDLDNHDPSEDSIVMMTIHAAKGLEFPTVFVVGSEEGLFPSARVIGEPEEMEEERRLCYVAMTRAKETLYMTCAAQRMLFGQTSNNRASRFTREIPDTLVERTGFFGGFGEGDDASFDRDRLGADRGGFTPERARRPVAAPSGGAGRERTGAGAPPFARAGAPRRAPMPSQPRAAVPLPSFSKGDVVQHKAFGRGLIVALQPMGSDALLEVAFDNGGTKRLMLRAAAQNMTKQD